MSAVSFRKRKLQVQLTLKAGTFADGSNSKLITDLAMTCTVEKLGPPDFSKCSVQIKGMKLEDMEQLTTLSFNPLFAYTARNFINIFAGDDDTGFAQIFAGTITGAGAVFADGQPGASFDVEGQVGFMGSVTPASPTAVSGTQSAATFIEKQASAAGMSFENQGVSATIKDCVFNGSAIQQARQCAEMVGADLIIDDEQMILIPGDGARDDGSMFLVSRESGLLGYPRITQSGVELRTIFNPSYKFAQCFELQSSVPKVSGIWRIIKLTHKLSSGDPKDGSWESQITGFYPHLSGATGKYI